MNRFINRIISQQSKTTITQKQFHKQLLESINNTDNNNKRLIWFGEYHSEQRIIAFLNQLVVAASTSLLSSSSSSSHNSPTIPDEGGEQQQPKLHIVMEHFSIEMQDLLHQFQNDPTFDFENLKGAYKGIGTEGHNLDPYRGLLLYCKKNRSDDDDGGGGGGKAGDVDVEDEDDDDETVLQDVVFRNKVPPNNIELYGGFIPRPCAAQWNKTENTDEKRKLLESFYEKGYLPPPSNPMNRVLLHKEEGGGGGKEEKGLLLLRGSSAHFQLIRSMMTGEDLYAPLDEEEEGGNDGYTGGDGGELTPIQRLYQAQLLKDHAMAYRISTILTSPSTLPHDRILVVAGLGHLKHGLGVPECLDSYLRADGRGETGEGGGGGIGGMGGSVMVGCQMLYETYLEDRYDPLKVAMAEEGDDEEEEDDDDDDDDDEEEEEEDEDNDEESPKNKVLNNLVLTQPNLFEKLLLESDIIQGPMFHHSNGKGRFQKPAYDYSFVYDENEDNLLTNNNNNTPTTCPFHSSPTSPSHSAAAAAVAADAIKVETQEAYNNVGQTATQTGNVTKARLIMKHLHYTEEQMDLIGSDYIYNFQGVANPHRVAKIQCGEAVLDIGSGLGVDSLLATRTVMMGGGGGDDGEGKGGGGRVLGIDLAPKQVAYANQMAREKGLSDVLKFVQGDAERLGSALRRALPLRGGDGGGGTEAKGSNEGGEEGMLFDVAISNGAFCLIPDKGKVFRQIYDALRPGGRMAISTTVIQKAIDDKTIDWPVCIRMFADLNDLRPMAESAGFEGVEIVDSESSMEMEIPMDVWEGDNPGRFKIHGGKYADQYDFLEKMDMDELCKVVTVFGVKPSSSV